MKWSGSGSLGDIPSPIEGVRGVFELSWCIKLILHGLRYMFQVLEMRFKFGLSWQRREAGGYHTQETGQSAHFCRFQVTKTGVYHCNLT